MAQVTGSAKMAQQELAIDDDRPAHASSQCEHDHILQAARGANPAFAHQRGVRIVENSNRADCAEQFGPVQALKPLQPAGHVKNTAAVGGGQTGRRHTDGWSGSAGRRAGELFLAGFGLHLPNQAANLVRPNHFFTRLKTQVGLKESVAVCGHSHAFNLRGSEINSDGVHNISISTLFDSSFRVAKATPRWISGIAQNWYILQKTAQAPK